MQEIHPQPTTDAPHGSGHGVEKRASRRTVMTGVAWTVRVVAFAGAAPAFAASQGTPEKITATGNSNNTPGEVVVSFSCPMTVTYDVQGASGGGAQANGRGRGARQAGTITLPAGVELRLIGGGQGAPQQSGLLAPTLLPGGRGYGDGGSTGTATPVGERARAGGGGGAGSAILTSANTPVVVSAGGGGIGAGVAGSWQQYPAGSIPIPTQELVATGALLGGGNGRAPGDSATDAGSSSGAKIDDIGSGAPNVVYTTFSGIAGGASGASGGTASSPETTYMPGNLHEAWIANNHLSLTGVSGGNFGTGSYGGGNGGQGSNSSTAAPNTEAGVAAAAGGGGGGYAGGAGGNSYAAYVRRVDTDNGGPDPSDSSNYSTGTGGGAGSSYRADSVFRISTTSTTAGVAGGIGDGFASISYVLPATCTKTVQVVGGNVTQTTP